MPLLPFAFYSYVYQRKLAMFVFLLSNCPTNVPKFKIVYQRQLNFAQKSRYAKREKIDIIRGNLISCSVLINSNPFLIPILPIKTLH